MKKIPFDVYISLCTEMLQDNRMKEVFAGAGLEKEFTPEQAVEIGDFVSQFKSENSITGEFVDPNMTVPIRFLRRVCVGRYSGVDDPEFMNELRLATEQNWRVFGD